MRAHNLQNNTSYKLEDIALEYLRFMLLFSKFTSPSIESIVHFIESSIL